MFFEDVEEPEVVGPAMEKPDSLLMNGLGLFSGDGKPSQDL